MYKYVANGHWALNEQSKQLNIKTLSRDRMCVSVHGYNYKTTVSSAREKVSILRTETDMARIDWLLFTYK